MMESYYTEDEWEVARQETGNIDAYCFLSVSDLEGMAAQIKAIWGDEDRFLALCEGDCNEIDYI